MLSLLLQSEIVSDGFFNHYLVIQVFVALFVAILFMETGLDKIFDWNGNMEFMNNHFSDTGLRDMVPFMLGFVTIIELLAGVLSLLGVVYLIFYGDNSIAFYGVATGAAAILMLFFGQRIAKDYAGASTLAVYFILCLIGLFMLKY